MYHRHAKRRILEEIMSDAPYGANYWLIRTHAGAKSQLPLQMSGGKGSQQLLSRIRHRRITSSSFHTDDYSPCHCRCEKVQADLEVNWRKSPLECVGAS
ncbi:hypothetical protein TNCV_1177651 [Trichonephila clavipes]|nr:hypothetical protein TNCV_1177651 [Trichonephila clavipes]